MVFKGLFDVDFNLRVIWWLGTILNIKKRGEFQYCIIPEDMLMRTYYANKECRDLLEWCFNLKQFIKLKLNQILMHILTLAI